MPFLYRVVCEEIHTKKSETEWLLEKFATDERTGNNERSQWRSRHRAERMVRRIFDLGFRRCFKRIFYEQEWKGERKERNKAFVTKKGAEAYESRVR